MMKALFALAKYLTWCLWWFIKPLGSWLCCNLTHMLQVSTKRKQHFPFLLGGENIINYFIKSIASSHYFIKSITSSGRVEDSPEDTLVHTFAHLKYLPAGLVSQKLILKSKIIPCYTTDCFKSSCLCPIFECVWFCNVTPDLYCGTVAQQTSR